MRNPVAIFGKLPSKAEAEAFKASAHFDAQRKIFLNRRPRIVDEMHRRTWSLAGIWKFFRDSSRDAVPRFVLPSVQPDFSRFQEPSPELKIVWFGHSSMLVNVGGLHVLVDPVLSEKTGPLGFLMPRFRTSVTKPEQLPRIDVVLITHDHYDHLDAHTVHGLLGRNVRYMTPLGVGAHLRSWGVDASRIQEFDWWQSAAIGDVTFTATPAQHFSGRNLTNQNKSLWASWVVKGKGHSIYFSGDSGYDTHFADIGTKLGPFDVAFIESGQYHPLWPEVHLYPEHSIQAFLDLRAQRYFPIHWGMFKLSTHAWYEPIEVISRLAQEGAIPLITPLIGELAVLNDAYSPASWWKQFVPAHAERAPLLSKEAVRATPGTSEEAAS